MQIVIKLYPESDLPLSNIFYRQKNVNTCIEFVMTYLSCTLTCDIYLTCSGLAV
jgi:hypothetical protein